MSLSVSKQTFRHICIVKIQISLCIHTIWSESSLGAFIIANDAKFLHADNEDMNTHVRMYIFSCCGSNVILFIRSEYTDKVQFSFCLSEAKEKNVDSQIKVIIVNKLQIKSGIKFCSISGAS